MSTTETSVTETAVPEKTLPETTAPETTVPGVTPPTPAASAAASTDITEVLEPVGEATAPPTTMPNETTAPDDITVTADVLTDEELSLLAASRTAKADEPSRPAPRGPARTPGATMRPNPAGDIGPRRMLRTATGEDRFNVLGSLIAAAAIAGLLFGWFAPLSGAVGWFVVAFLAFIGIYALMVSFRGDAETVKDRVMTALLYGAGAILLSALIFVLVYTLVRGAAALFNVNFVTQTMELAGPLDPLSMGGILHAIVGTLIQIGIALIITVPLGITTAVFLNEFPGRFSRFVRTISDAMTALPSIVAGLFVYACVIMLFTHQRSGFAAALAISVMMLPIIIRASDVVLRLVSGSLREASYALGAPRWRTVWHVVLPTARSGLVNAVILGTARGVGETSPVLLTSGVTAVMNFNPFSGPMISLPLQVFDFVKSPEPNMVARGFGAAAVLIILVLVLFVIARAFGGRSPGQLSDGQRRRAAEASLNDLRRMTMRTAPPAPETQTVVTVVPTRKEHL
ncbi:phosphate ABC transporter permease PstA [Compostimonas suwonensis]|uniref:Phosphate transport system permease protein PstA n=1 Tax=Compostimonas suwonensis TaxID=1048394 RepID=A0A2M9C3F7_9MICO|nr:phosphate ABC transporter permease PstA [Compostimonas suwonensis]PJJ64987.1 phosphate transport system permease protein [Compostimonas suwonensis]